MWFQNLKKNKGRNISSPLTYTNHTIFPSQKEYIYFYILKKISNQN
jgi:hypothetical protein